MTSTHSEEAGISRRGASFTAQIGNRRLRRLAVLPLVMLVAAIVSNAGNAGSAGAETEQAVAQPAAASSELNRVAIPNFDPKTWKPTPAAPLPTMQSPITFQVKDTAS